MADLPNDSPTTSAGGAIPTSPVSKESDFGRAEITKTPEKAPVVEVGFIPETQAEQEGYIQRIEKEVELKKPVLDDQGQVLVTSPSAQAPKIVLPVTQGSYLNPANWKLPVETALRWLLEWTKKIVKMYPGRTVFRN